MPTNIAWTDETWNPVHGCSKVSAGCDNCYAERISNRYEHTEHPWEPEHAAENVQLKPEKLDWPGTLDEPKRIFVNSMSDLFHSQVPDEFVGDVFASMRNFPEHVFQILTKRPGRAAQMDLQWPPNVWMGTSVEDERVLERLELLRPCGADVLFVSFEPLIGPLGDGPREICDNGECPDCDWVSLDGSESARETAYRTHHFRRHAAKPDLSGFDWAIVGGESGPNDVRREMAHEWVWPIRDACRRDGLAFFFKQSSAPQPERGQQLRCPDGVRREFRELPEPHDAVDRARRSVADGGGACGE